MRSLPAWAVALLLWGVAAGADFHTIDGKTTIGELKAVDAKGMLTVQPENGAATRLPADEVMRIDFTEDVEPDELLEGVILYLPHGDRMGGKLVKSSQTSLEIESASLGKVKLSLENLIAIEFRRAGEQLKDIEKMRAQLLNNRTRNDVSFSANGDQVSGILVGFDGNTVALKSSLGNISLKTSRLFGVALAARSRRPPPPTLLAVVRCMDGSRVTGQLRPAPAGGLTLQLLAGPQVRVAKGQLIDVVFKQGKLVYLSDLKPSAQKVTPYFGGDPTWPYRRDRNYDGKPIRVAGKTYQKGLGMFSGMTLTYDLGGGFKKFAARVGIDDADINNQGDVTVRVLADGKEAYKKAGLTRRGGPAAVQLSMEAVKTLQLVVEFGGNMHFGDLTDWANAHLIR